MRYLFILSNGNFLEAHHGIEFSNQRQAEAFALRLFARIFPRMGPRHWVGATNSVSVTDETGMVVRTVSRNPR